MGAYTFPPYKEQADPVTQNRLHKTPLRGFFIAREMAPIVRKPVGRVMRLGLWPNFCFYVAHSMQAADSQLTLLARRVVEPLGYELVGVEYFRKGGGATLRVYIDHERGITLDDCAAVSHQLSGVLDVEDPIADQYDLEVSSPGLDRPLVFPEHFARFAGSRVRIRLNEKVEGRRKLEGILLGRVPGGIALRTEERDWEIPLTSIESARLSPDFPGRPGSR